MEQIYVQTFGKLTVYYNGRNVTEENSKSRKTWSMIKYLLAEKGNRYTSEELIRSLKYRDLSDQSSSLKTVIHRARTIFKQLDIPEAPQFICQQNSKYFWNTELCALYDCDIFTDLHRKAKKTIDPKERFKYQAEALKLYKGSYLNKGLSDIPSVADSIKRYHIMAIDLFEGAATHLTNTKDFLSLEELCLKMLEIDPYQETFHYYLIKSAIGLEEHEKAMLYFTRVNEMFVGKFRINPSDRIRALHRFILGDMKSGETDIKKVKNSLLAKENSDSGTLCQYDTFRLICKNLVNAANGEFSALSQRLVLISVFPRENDIVPGERTHTHAINNLQRLISSLLLPEEPFTRFSASQFLALITVNKSGEHPILSADIDGDFRAMNGSFLFKIETSTIELEY